MPGVPNEMKWITTHHVLQIIQEKFNTGFIEHRTLLTAGVGESFLAEMIQDFEKKIPSNIKLAYLPNYGMVRLRLTGLGNNKTELDKELDPLFNELKKLVIVGPWVIRAIELSSLYLRCNIGKLPEIHKERQKC